MAGRQWGVKEGYRRGSHEATSLVLVREAAEALNSIADESIDFVYSNAVLEHVVDMQARRTRTGARFEGWSLVCASNRLAGSPRFLASVGTSDAER